MLRVVHVVGRGPSPFPAHIGPMPHLAFLPPTDTPSIPSNAKSSKRVLIAPSKGSAKPVKGTETETTSCLSPAPPIGVHVADGVRSERPAPAWPCRRRLRPDRRWSAWESRTSEGDPRGPSPDGSGRGERQDRRVFVRGHCVRRRYPVAAPDADLGEQRRSARGSARTVCQAKALDRATSEAAHALNLEPAQQFELGQRAGGAIR